MTITRTQRGDYVAVFQGHMAYGYTFSQAILNLLTII